MQQGKNRNIRLTIEYDGTHFHGWQIQPGQRTVQGTIEQKLAVLLQETVSLISAGRTDAGAHALGQVANFHTRTDLHPDNIKNGLNSLLPEDVVIHQVENVPEDFHSRFDAKRRLYRYRISKVKRALGRDYVWHVSYSLDLDRMNNASSPLIGTHDFASFCSASSEVEEHTCTVSRCRWSEDEHEIRLEMEADRFLHSMVRTIVGTMVDIGRGKLPPEAIEEILASRDRRRAGPTAPARGLCLIEVSY